MLQDAKSGFSLYDLISVTWRGTCFCNSNKSSTPSKTRNSSNFNASTYSRFAMKQLQLYGFLLLVLLPSTMAVPVRGKRSSTDKVALSDEIPHWVTPCPGVPTSGQADKRSDEEYESTGSDIVFIKSIISSAQLASHQAKEFREAYVLKRFGLDFKANHNNFKDKKYSWLLGFANIPKELGEEVSKEHLETLSMDDEPLKIYGYLQRLAVAFEQVIQDHRDQNSEFKNEFADAERHLKSLLCELIEIIPQSKLDMYKNVEREIMTPEFRHMQNITHQYVRDWLIFRDYMNLVEYIEQVMNFFLAKMVI